MNWIKIKESSNYEVSENGDIRNISTGELRKCHQRKDGYLDIRFPNRNLLLHRIIATAFIPNPDNLPYVNHKNGKKYDNRIENLEWCTGQYNRIHAVKSGLITNTTKGIRMYSKLDEAQVLTIRKCLANGMICKPLADYFKVSQTLISAIKRRVVWSSI